MLVFRKRGTKGQIGRGIQDQNAASATYIGETGRKLHTEEQLKNGDNKNHIAEHHLQPDHRIWDSPECISFSIDYYQQRI